MDADDKRRHYTRVTYGRPGFAPVGRQRAGRNDPCPCGSGKKFKRCHAAPPPVDEPVQAKAA